MKNSVTIADYCKWRDQTNGARLTRAIHYQVDILGKDVLQGMFDVTPEDLQKVKNRATSSTILATLDRIYPALREMIVTMYPELDNISGIQWRVTHIDFKTHEVWVSGCVACRQQ